MRRIVPFLYYSRSGRRVVVYGKPEQLHRPNYGGRGDYRVPDSNRAIRAGRHHDRCRWRSMVCSNQRQSNRPDHNGRGNYGIQAPVRECQTPCHHGGRFRGSMVYRMGSQSNRTNYLHRGHYRVSNPYPSAEPHGITVDSGGEVWFAEECDQIGRFTIQY